MSLHAPPFGEEQDCICPDSWRRTRPRNHSPECESNFHTRLVEKRKLAGRGPAEPEQPKDGISFDVPSGKYIALSTTRTVWDTREGAEAFMQGEAPRSPAPVETPIDPTQAHDPHVDRLADLIQRSLANGGCSNCGALPHTTTCRVGRLARALQLSPSPVPVNTEHGLHTAQAEADLAALRASVQATVKEIRSDAIKARMYAMNHYGDRLDHWATALDAACQGEP